MRNQCINFRQRIKIKEKKKKGYFYCIKHKKEIIFDDCKGCPYKEYKNKKRTEIVKKSTSKRTNSQKSPIYCAKMKKKSNKLAKLERNRFSLFTDDLEHCIICDRSPVNKHEIFGGSANRKNSMKYGLVIPLCIAEHHNQIECKGIHFDKALREEWKQKGQALFQETYPDLIFEDIFKSNYF